MVDATAITRAGGSSSSEPVVSVSNLTIALRRGSSLTPLVDGVSFSVRPGEAIAIVGESGSGKSLSIRGALGLTNKRRFHTEGKVVLDGVEMSTLKGGAARIHAARTAGLVFQDPTRSLNPTMRVGMQIAERIYKSRANEGKVSKEDAKKRSIELMREVLISDPEERFYAFPHELSGGMRQRIVIAIALAGNPKVLFADEPTTSLDVTTQAQIMEVLEALREHRSLAVVLITHDLSIAASRVERVYVMYAGKIVEELPVAELARGSKMPYTQALLRAVPSAVREKGALPAPLVGAPPDPQFMPLGCRFHPRCPRAQEVCSTTEPELVEIAPWHKSACLFPGPDEFIGVAAVSASAAVPLAKDWSDRAAE